MTQPFLLMVAGPNGSGKTTLTATLREAGIKFGRLHQSGRHRGGTIRRLRQESFEAQKTADKMRDKCLDEGVSFSFETVMSHPSKLEILQRAKSRGFLVIVYFVSTSDPRINVARVAQRVASGGHDVPEDRIIGRYARAMAQLPDAIAASDRTYLFDNSDLKNEEGDTGLRWVASFGEKR